MKHKILFFIYLFLNLSLPPTSQAEENCPSLNGQPLSGQQIDFTKLGQHCLLIQNQKATKSRSRSPLLS